MDAAVVADHLWQRVGIGRLELVHLSVVDDELRDLVSLGQIHQDVVARRDLSGRGLLTSSDVELRKDLPDLLRRADVEFASRDLIQAVAKFIQLLRDVLREKVERVAVHLHACQFNLRENRNERQLDV